MLDQLIVVSQLQPKPADILRGCDTFVGIYATHAAAHLGFRGL
jgi:hypothetical protein